MKAKAIETTSPTCLPPEAYLQIIRNCKNTEPKFRSSYPPKIQKKNTGEK